VVVGLGFMIGVVGDLGGKGGERGEALVEVAGEGHGDVRGAEGGHDLEA
jgi:hypothetical protein